MKHKRIIIIGILASFFLFLFPIAEIEHGCYGKPTASEPNQAEEGTGVSTSIGIYTIIFLNGGRVQMEMNNSICEWHIYHPK